jgi:hypothetical protein
MDVETMNMILRDQFGPILFIRSLQIKLNNYGILVS